MKGALVVSACVPVPEPIRHALQPYLTSSQSEALYRRFLTDTLETTLDVEGMDVYLAYSPRGCRQLLSDLAPPQVRLVCQEGPDTGVRFAKLAARLLDAGYERVLLVCTTHPDLPSCMLHQAVDTLAQEDVDMVLGPNERGRFYLVGLKERYPSLFSGIDWEGEGLDRHVTAWARKKRVRLERLPVWYDIRNLADLRRHLAYYQLRRSASKECVSQTGKYLSRIQARITAPQR